jgi:hypothetical protein
MPLTKSALCAKKGTRCMILSFLFLNGCIDEPAKSADLVGIWVATPKSVAMLDTSPVQRAPQPRLQLMADGSFVASELPKRLVTAAASARHALIAGSGHWSLRDLNSEQTLALTFEKINGIVTESSCYLDISSQGGTTGLYFFFEEPDAGDRFELEKLSPIR